MALKMRMSGFRVLRVINNSDKRFISKDICDMYMKVQNITVQYVIINP